MKYHKRAIALLTCYTILCLTLQAQPFCINKGEKVSIYLPKQSEAIVHSATRMLGEDMEKVLNASLSATPSTQKANIVCKKDNALPREGFRITTRKGKLYIAGADSHGIAFGLLEISRLMGVSPWEWWADCTPKKQEMLRIEDNTDLLQHPKVAFRGIFINDEDWGMNPWAQQREPESLVVKSGRIVGAIGPKTTEKIFQLLLRLRMNYYWPAMHECTQPFFLTPGNRDMAAKYGIYIGGSHCEPMACSAAAEWSIRGNGNYNYVTNAKEVKQFWQNRLNEVKDQDIVYTIGMRGVHDGAMEGTKTREEKLKYLQMVIDDQRKMLQQTLKKKAEDIPQVFIPYKEVLDIYHDGLEVPNDVTLMWTDDNYGYIRQFPNETERMRKGGNGLYYHASYWGRPHDYTWLATLSPYLMEQQLTEAFNRGIQQMWVLNVGDVKPAEFEIELFANLAWDGLATNTCDMHTARDMMYSFYAREFGERMAKDLAPVMEDFYRLAWDRKPEHMAGTRVEEQDKSYWQQQIHPIEYWTSSDVEKRIRKYKEISDNVEKLWSEVSENKQDAFFQLVKYPIQGCAQMNFKFLCPELSKIAYDSIVSLTKQYNKGFHNNGKWNLMMSEHPRSLLVFSEINPQQLPKYETKDLWTRITPQFKKQDYPSAIEGLGTNGSMLMVENGKSYSFEINKTISLDSLTFRIRLLPNLPIDDKRLTFAISVDGDNEQLCNYETYDRSEEWKKNVLRNYAERIVKLPINNARCPHSITFRAETEGVVLSDIYIMERK